MSKLPKRYAASFHKSQGLVTDVLRPYLPRCLGQYFDHAGAVESFVVYSKEADAFEGRHRIRGVVTVHYNFPVHQHAEAQCGMMFSYSEDLVGNALGVKHDTSWDSTKNMLDRLLPALPPE